MRCGSPTRRLAQQWRLAVREALAALVADGARITGFDRSGWYVVQERACEARPGVELRRISMPLVSPFRTSFGTQTARELLLLRVVTDEGEGWGECVAMADPLYSSEYVDGAADVLRRFLVPALAAAGPLEAHRVATVLAPFKGHRMAKAALEMGVLDAELRAEGRSFARELGAVHDRVPCGVSVGIMDSIPAAARRGRRLPRRGLRADQAEDRARLGRRAGARGPRDVRRRRAAAGRRQHGVHARRRAPPRPLDPFDLLLIEQPLDEEDVLGHADLAQPDRDAGLPRRVDRLGAVGGRGDPARRLRDRQHQARPGRRLPRGPADPRRLRRRTASRCGAAACSRPASAGRPTSPSPRCPASRCRATPRGRTATTAPTSPSRSCSTTATSTVPTGPGLGVAAARGRAGRGHRRRRSGSRPDRLSSSTNGPLIWSARRSRLAQPAYRQRCCRHDLGPEPRPRASLGRVLDDLGATLLDLVHGDPERADDIGGVVIHDPVDAPVLPPTRWCSASASTTPSEVVALLDELGASRRRRAGAARAGPADAGGPRGRRRGRGRAARPEPRCARGPTSPRCCARCSPRATSASPTTETLGGLPSGDLFAVANAIAALLDAPITIEDRSSRVLAFSGRQDEADPSRVETILGRQVPERYSRILNERGVFRELYRSDRPVFIEPGARR